MTSDNSTLHPQNNRIDPILKGLKHGAIKGGVEKFTAPITAPVSQAINSKLVELFPQATITAPMVDGIVRFGAMILLAEVLNIASTTMGQTGGESATALKTKLAAEFLREFAGEQMGVGLVDLISAVVPYAMTAFKDISIQDLSLVLADSSSQEQAPALLLEETVETNLVSVPLLATEPQKVMVRKRGRPKKQALKNPDQAV